jgi:hypothetical protein
MRTKSGVGWIDAAIEEADKNGFPLIRDRDDCRLIVSRLIGHPIGDRTYRDAPVATFIVHGRAKQHVADAVAYAWKLIAEAPPHMPEPPRRRARIKPGKRASGDTEALIANP